MKRILILTNQYSYYQRKDIKGPKSLIKLLTNLSNEANTKLDFLIKKKGKCASIGRFPFNCNVKRFSSPIDLFITLWKLKLDSSETVIIFDRKHILIGLLISKFFRFKSCLRLLGRARRLNSKNRFGLARFLKIISIFLKVDLVIETIDGSAKSSSPVINAKKYIKRLNGAELVRGKLRFKDANAMISVGRFSSEKDIVSVINIFRKIRKYNQNLILNIFGVTFEQFQSLKYNGSIENCKFHGFVEPEVVSRFLEVSNIFISGNKLGLLGNAEIEAIQNGLKVINATNSSIENLPSKYQRFFSSFDDYIYSKKVDSLGFNQLPAFEKVHQEDTNLLLELFK